MVESIQDKWMRYTNMTRDQYYKFLRTQQDTIIVVPNKFCKWKKEQDKYTWNDNTDMNTIRHRITLDNEIIIEFDHVENGVGKMMVNATCENLAKNHLNYALFDHGGKSPHIHLWVKDLDKVEYNQRKKYKKNFIKRYVPQQFLKNADMGFTGTHMVAMEFQPHHKYGTFKKMKEWTGPNKINNFDPTLLPKVTREYTTPQIQNTIAQSDPMIAYLMTNPLPAGNRHNTICKNLGIALNNMDVGEDVKERIIKEVSKNYKGKDYNTVKAKVDGWRKWAWENKANHYNIQELKNYFRTHGVNL